MEQLEKQSEELEKAMDAEYEKNKESSYYQKLRIEFLKAQEEYYDAYNHRRKRCIRCGGFEFGENRCLRTDACVGKPNWNDYDIPLLS